MPSRHVFPLGSGYRTFLLATQAVSRANHKVAQQTVQVAQQRSVPRKAGGTGEPGADNGERGFGTVELTFSPETNYLARPAVTMQPWGSLIPLPPFTILLASQKGFLQTKGQFEFQVVVGDNMLSSGMEEC